MVILPDIFLWENLSGSIGDIKNFSYDSPAKILFDNIAKTHCSQLWKTRGSG